MEENKTIKKKKSEFMICASSITNEIQNDHDRGRQL